MGRDLRSQSAAADALSLPIGKKRDDSIDPQVLTSFFMALKPLKRAAPLFLDASIDRKILAGGSALTLIIVPKPVTLIAGTQRPAASVRSGFATEGANHI